MFHLTTTVQNDVYFYFTSAPLRSRVLAGLSRSIILLLHSSSVYDLCVPSMLRASYSLKLVRMYCFHAFRRLSMFGKLAMTLQTPGRCIDPACIYVQQPILFC